DAAMFTPDLDAERISETPEPEVMVEIESEEAEVHEPVQQEPEPEPEPDMTPAPRPRRSSKSHHFEQTQSAPVDDKIRSWRQYDFARLDGFAEVAQVPGGYLHITPNQTGGLDLEWGAPSSPGSGARVFHVVSDEMEFEQDPDLGEYRVSTVGERWVDDEPLTTAYRMYQVWMYEGP